MHESISSTFYACIFCTKFWHQNLQSSVLGLKFFGAKISYKRPDGKTLVKLTPAELYQRDDNSHLEKSDVLHRTAARRRDRKMLLALHQVSISSKFYLSFLLIFWRQKISNTKHSFAIFGAKISSKECVSKTLVKLTSGNL